MGFRFQRRITLAPGIRLNLSKSGLGLSVGPRGASLSVGPRGAYGHAAGDTVIRAVVTIIADSVRDIDLVGRFGGAKFSAGLLADQADAVVVAKRTRQAIEHAVIEAEAQRIQVTISLGLAGHEPGEVSLEPALQHADQDLYAAKRAGRNRVAVNQSSSLEA